jgi:hypothetical protein
MDPEVLAAIEEQLGELQQYLGVELDQDDLSVLLERVGENAEQTGEIDLYTAHDELVAEGEDGEFYEPDGYEDWVEGQTAMLEEVSGKRLDPAARAELAAASRYELDPLGRPDVNRAWLDKQGEIPNPDNTNERGRQQRMANEIESAQVEEQQEKELFGSSDDPEGLTGMPKFDSEPKRLAFLAQQVEEASEQEAERQATSDAELDERLQAQDDASWQAAADAA